MSFADMARAVLAHQGRDDPVVIDPQATYFGTPVDESSLVTVRAPSSPPHRSPTGSQLGEFRPSSWVR